MRFKELLEATHIIVLSDDMKEYAEEAYLKTKLWLDLQKVEGYSPEHIYKNLEIEDERIFRRKVTHPVYENDNPITLSILARPPKGLIRFEGGFDCGTMDSIFIYFMTPKQIKNFSDKSIKNDFIDRIRHELLHAIDPINNEKVIRKELEVDKRMKDQGRTKDFKTYLNFEWEIRANLSSMAERAIENMFEKKWDYEKIKKEINNWEPKLSHSNYQKELDYFKDENIWKQYKEFLKKLLEIKMRKD